MYRFKYNRYIIFHESVLEIHMKIDQPKWEDKNIIVKPKEDENGGCKKVKSKRRNDLGFEWSSHCKRVFEE